MKAETARRAEFVGTALQMAFPEAVEHAFCPRFQVGEHAVSLGEDRVRLATADDLRFMRVGRRIFVTGPAIRDDVSVSLCNPCSVFDAPCTGMDRCR